MPAQAPSDRLQLRIPPDILARMAELAKEHDRSVSAEVRQAIRVYLRVIDRQATSS